MNITTYGDISPRVAASAAKRMLGIGQHIMVWERFGQVDAQPKNSSLTRKWRRYEALSRAVAPLAEGVTPMGQKLTITDVTATLAQYGDFVTITDVIQDVHEDPVLMIASERCGQQIAETKEELRYGVLRGGSNVFYAGSATTRATVNETIKRGDLRKISRMFKRYKASYITKIVKAGTAVATEPVAAAFYAVASSDMEHDIRQITGFLPAEKYASGVNLVDGEIGKVDDIRFICTAMAVPFLAAGTSGDTFLTNGGSGMGNCDVYPVIFVAADAYGIVPLQGAGAVVPTVVNPKPVQGDELGQRGSVGWKMWDATVILNQLWMARLECAATANPV